MVLLMHKWGGRDASGIEKRHAAHEDVVGKNTLQVSATQREREQAAAWHATRKWTDMDSPKRTPPKSKNKTPKPNPQS